MASGYPAIAMGMLPVGLFAVKPDAWDGRAAYALEEQVSYQPNPAVPAVLYKCIVAVPAAPAPAPLNTVPPSSASWVLQLDGEPAFTPGSNYTPGDVVSFANGQSAPAKLYMCLVPTSASPAVEPDRWKAFASGSSEDLTITSANGSGANVSESPAGTWNVSAALSALPGSGVVLTPSSIGKDISVSLDLQSKIHGGISVGGSTTAQTKFIELNQLTPLGCGITVAPGPVGSTAQTLSVNLATEYGLAWTPSTVNTSITIKTAFSGTNDVASAVVASGTIPVVALPTYSQTVTADSVYIITPLNSLVQAPQTVAACWHLEFNNSVAPFKWELHLDFPTGANTGVDYEFGCVLLRV